MVMEDQLTKLASKYAMPMQGGIGGQHPQGMPGNGFNFNRFSSTINPGPGTNLFQATQHAQNNPNPAAQLNPKPGLATPEGIQQAMQKTAFKAQLDWVDRLMPYIFTPTKQAESSSTGTATSSPGTSNSSSGSSGSTSTMSNSGFGTTSAPQGNQQNAPGSQNQQQAQADGQPGMRNMPGMQNGQQVGAFGIVQPGWQALAPTSGPGVANQTGALKPGLGMKIAGMITPGAGGNAPTPGLTANAPVPQPGMAPTPPSVLPPPPPNGGAPIDQGMGQPSVDPATGQPLPQGPPPDPNDPNAQAAAGGAQQGAPPQLQPPVDPITGQPVSSPMQDPPPPTLPANPRLLPPRPMQMSDQHQNAVSTGLGNDMQMANNPVSQHDSHEDLKTGLMAMDSKTAGFRVPKTGFWKLAGFGFDAESTIVGYPEHDAKPRTIHDSRPTFMRDVPPRPAPGPMDSQATRSFVQQRPGMPSTVSRAGSTTRLLPRPGVGGGMKGRLAYGALGLLGGTGIGAAASSFFGKKGGDSGGYPFTLVAELSKEAVALPGAGGASLLRRPWQVNLHETPGVQTPSVIGGLIQKLKGGVGDVGAALGLHNKTIQSVKDLHGTALAGARAARTTERQMLSGAKQYPSSYRPIDPAKTDLGNMQANRYAGMVDDANSPVSKKVYGDLGLSTNPLKRRLYSVDTVRSTRRLLDQMEASKARGRETIGIGAGGLAGGAAGAGLTSKEAADVVLADGTNLGDAKVLGEKIASKLYSAAGDNPVTQELYAAMASHMAKLAAQASDGKYDTAKSPTGESKGLSLSFDSDHHAFGREAWDTIPKYLRSTAKKKNPDPSVGKHASAMCYDCGTVHPMEGECMMKQAIHYNFDAEDCPKCGASMEGDSYTGTCNSCQHKWGTKKASVTPHTLAEALGVAAGDMVKAAVGLPSWVTKPVGEGINYGKGLLGMGKGGVGAAPAAGAARPFGAATAPGVSTSRAFQSGQAMNKAVSPYARVAGQPLGGAALGAFGGSNMPGGHVNPETGQYEGGGTGSMMGDAAVGAAVFNPWMRRMMGSGGAKSIVNTPVRAIQGGLAGSMGGSGLDMAADAAGVKDTHFARTGAMLGTGFGGVAGAGRSMRQWGAPGSGMQQLGKKMMQFGEGGLAPVSTPIRAMGKALGGGGAGGLSGASAVNAASHYGNLGRRSAMGLGGFMGIQQGIQGLKDESARHFADTADAYVDSRKGEWGDTMQRGVDNYLDEKGLMDQHGRLNPMGPVMNGIKQQAGGHMDQLLHSMGMDPQRMSPMQKMMLLGGGAAAGGGLVAGSPLLAAGGGLAAMGGLLPHLMPGQGQQQLQGQFQQGQGQPQQGPQQPPWMRHISTLMQGPQRNEFQHQQQLQQQPQG